METIHFTKFHSQYSSKIEIFLLYILIIFLFIRQSTSQLSVTNIVQLQRQNVTEVFSVVFGTNDDIIYYSIFNSQTNLYQIQKFSVTTLKSAPQTSPLTVFTLGDQFSLPDKMLQLKSLYLVSYSSQNFKAQIFDMSGNSYLVRNFSSRVSQILYSIIRDEIYLIFQNGAIQIWTLNSFLGIQNPPITVTLANIGDVIKARLCPQQIYLAVGTVNSAIMKIYNLNTRSLFDTAFFAAFFDTTCFVWNNISTIIYTYDESNGEVYETVLGGGPSVPNSIYMFPFQYIMYSIKYIYQSNELFFIGTPLGLPNNVIYVTYNIDALFQLPWYNQDQGSSPKGVSFSHNLNSPVYYFTLWQQLPVTKTDIVQVVVENVPIPSPPAPTPPTPTPTPIVIPVNPSNLTNLTINNSLIYESSQLYPIYNRLLNNLLIQNNGLNALNKLPSARNILKPIFLFFANFDDLWLYNYHDIEYNQLVEQLLASIRKLQKQKWETLNYQQVWQNYLGLNITSYQQKLNNNTKIQFSSVKFVQVQGNSNGYILNTLNFFIINLQFIIVTYFIGNYLFKILSRKNIRIKQFFEKFNFGLFICILILQGNIQFMMYLFGFQMISLVEINFKQKIMEVGVLTVNFFFIFICNSLFFIIETRYQEKSACLFENISNFKYGSIYLTFQWSIRNLMLGFVHIAIPSYLKGLKIGVLILIEFFSAIINIVYIARTYQKGFILKTRVWVNIFCCLSRIMLISTFLIQTQEQVGISYVGDTTMAIIINYLLLWVISMLFESSALVLQISDLLKQGQQNKIKKKNTELQNDKKNQRQTQQFLIQKQSNIDMNQLNFIQTQAIALEMKNNLNTRNQIRVFQEKNKNNALVNNLEKKKNQVKQASFKNKLQLQLQKSRINRIKNKRQNQDKQQEIQKKKNIKLNKFIRTNIKIKTNNPNGDKTLTIKSRKNISLIHNKQKFQN